MPVSPNTKFEIPERKIYDAIPGDVYQVQVTDISEKLMPPYGKPFDIPDEEKETFINFEFTILDDGEYRGRKLWKAVRPVPPTPPEDSKFKPSWMYRIVSAIQGMPMTYANGIDWGADQTNDLIGKQMRVTVTKTEKGEKSYNNITEVLPAKVQLEPIEANNEPTSETAPAAQNAPSATPGYDKLKSVADRLNISPASQNEPVAEDIQEMADEMANDDMPPF
ncbi:MAG TPA: hypothetical protein VF571_09315 [Pyrinomonadaceae bacterium]|jgi:hypothetical protein